MKNDTLFQAHMKRLIEESEISLESRILIMGGSGPDLRTLTEIGFKNITFSNLEKPPKLHVIQREFPNVHYSVLDAESIDLPDRSFEIIYAHEVLHHCRSPHRALCEMMRVSGRFLIAMEPNDSATMRWLVRNGYSFPYEVAAVKDHGFIPVLREQGNKFLFVIKRHEELKPWLVRNQNAIEFNRTFS